MRIFEILAPFDWAVLRFFNVTLQHPWLDQFWLTITQLHKLWWMQAIGAPLILIALFYRWGGHALKPLVAVALTLGLTDAVGYRLIKKNVGRPRPIENPAIAGWVRPVGRAHGSSFPSNHAANSFAAAGILAWYFAGRRRYFVTFALLVATSRVALGVHYPSDVISGAMIGTLVAFFVNALVISPNKFWRLPVGGPRISGRKQRTDLHRRRT